VRSKGTRVPVKNSSLCPDNRQFNAGGDRLGDNVLVPATASGAFIYVALVKGNNIGACHNLVDDDAQNRPMLWIQLGF
jgi:hypothetical protein